MAHREPHPETLTPFTLSTGDPFPPSGILRELSCIRRMHMRRDHTNPLGHAADIAGGV